MTMIIIILKRHSKIDKIAVFISSKTFNDIGLDLQSIVLIVDTL